MFAILRFVTVTSSLFWVFGLRPTTAVSAGTFKETQTLTLADPQPFDDLGFSIAATDGLVIAGAINIKNEPGSSVGAAYIYQESTSGHWNQVAELRAEDGEGNDAFGWSVGIDGNFAIVGSPFHEHPHSPQGAVYFFHRENEMDWKQIGEVTAPDDAIGLGADIDIDGTQAVATGAWPVDLGPGPRGGRGFVGVYELADQTTWQQTQIIDIGDQRLTSARDVALDDGNLIVGVSQRASLTQDRSFSVEIFTDSPTGFQHTATLVPPTSPTETTFGLSVAIDKDRLIVGTPHESGHGAAYIYERNSDAEWEQVARLIASDSGQRRLFGGEVSIHGNLAFINSRARPGFPYGRNAYVFEYIEDQGWVEVSKLTSAQLTFGHVVATHGG